MITKSAYFMVITILLFTFPKLSTAYYDSSSGRFLSPDPADYSGSIDLYDYANSDPVNFLDPDGRLFQNRNMNYVNSEQGFAEIIYFTTDTTPTDSPFMDDTIRGAVLGDFGGLPTAGSVTGQNAIGFVPILGQLADIRDAAAGIYYFDNSREAFIGLVIAGIGFVPFGDLAKAFRYEDYLKLPAHLRVSDVNSPNVHGPYSPEEVKARIEAAIKQYRDSVAKDVVAVTIKEVVMSKQFGKDLVQAESRGWDMNHVNQRIDEASFLLKNEVPLPAHFKNHPLKTDSNLHEIHINGPGGGDQLATYRIKDKEIVWERLGTHKDLFGRKKKN